MPSTKPADQNSPWRRKPGPWCPEQRRRHNAHVAAPPPALGARRAHRPLLRKSKPRRAFTMTTGASHSPRSLARKFSTFPGWKLARSPRQAFDPCGSWASRVGCSRRRPGRPPTAVEWTGQGQSLFHAGTFAAASPPSSSGGGHGATPRLDRARRHELGYAAQPI
jgi:hypothetical protein